MSKKIFIVLLIIILIVGIFTAIFLFNNDKDGNTKKGNIQEQATTKELQTKIEDAIRGKLSETAS